MGSTAEIIWAMLFGALGLGYLTYGRRQRAVAPFVCGVGLVIFPYFMRNVYVLVLCGALLLAVPYFLR